MLGNSHRLSAFLVLLLGCNSSSQSEDPDPERSAKQESEQVVLDLKQEALPKETTPSKAAAAQVLQDFTQAVLEKDYTTAKKYLRVPASLNDSQVNLFLRELHQRNHLSHSGTDRVVEQPFGPLSQQFGDMAPRVARHAGLPLEQAYAFGDVETGAVLHWDGAKFSVSAVHNLGAPLPSESF